MKIKVRPRADVSERGYLLVRDMRRKSSKVYFADKPVEVARDVYINRRLACGDLVLVVDKPKPKPAPKKKED